MLKGMFFEQKFGDLKKKHYLCTRFGWKTSKMSTESYKEKQINLIFFTNTI